MSNTNNWSTFIAPIVTATGMDEAAVGEALKSLIGEPGEPAIALLQSEDDTPFAEIQPLFPEVPKAVLRKAINGLRKAKAADPAATAAPAALNLDVLPVAPDDSTWLTALKSGGELRVDQTTVVSAIRAAIANRVGLYDVPALLTERMEQTAETLEEPVGQDFYRLRKLLAQRSYAEIFAALEGVEGQFVTEKRKTALLTKLDTTLWPALLGFQTQLKGWTDSWQQGSANPAIMMTALTAVLAGGAGSPLPPGIMQPPATDSLRDAAESVITQINRIFAGTGIPVARALAYDAHRVKEVLENPALPAQVGAANRDQMLKMLNVAVSADYVRLERSITRYALAIMGLQNVTPGNDEIAYLSSLVMLGNQIPWSTLQAPARRASLVTSRRD